MPTSEWNFRASGQDSVVTAFRSIDQAAQKSQRATAQGFRKMRTSAERELRPIQKLAKRVAQDQALATFDAKAAGKAEREASRQSGKMRRGRARRRLARIREAKREAQQLQRIEVRKQQAMAKAQKRAADQERQATTGRRRRVAGGAIRGAGAVLGAGAVVAGAAARQALSLREKATRISIQARDPGKEGVDPAQLQREFQQTALKVVGTSAGDVASAVSAFVTKTGEIGLARQLQETFATVSQATGTDMAAIADAAADMMTQFDIKTIEGMQDAFATLTFQGKKGSFELKDAASQFAKLGAAAQRLGIGKGQRGVAQLGGLTQIARGATGSAEQASTAVQAMFRQLVAKSGDLEREGVKVFDEKGNARNIETVLTETVSRVGGTDLKQKKIGLQKIFGDEGIKALSPLIDAYAKATGDAAAKTKAVAAVMASAIDAPGKWRDVVQDAAIAGGTASSQITTAWESIVASVGTTLVPVLGDAATALAGFLTESSFLEVASGTLGVIFEVLGGAAKGLISIIESLPGFEKKELGVNQQIINKQREREALESKKEATMRKVRGGKQLSNAEVIQLNIDQQKIIDLKGEEAALEKGRGGGRFRKAGDVDALLTRQKFEEEAQKLGLGKRESAGIAEDILASPVKAERLKFSGPQGEARKALVKRFGQDVVSSRLIGGGEDAARVAGREDVRQLPPEEGGPDVSADINAAGKAMGAAGKATAPLAGIMARLREGAASAAKALADVKPTKRGDVDE